MKTISHATQNTTSENKRSNRIKKITRNKRTQLFETSNISLVQSLSHTHNHKKASTTQEKKVPFSHFKTSQVLIKANGFHLFLSLFYALPKHKNRQNDATTAGRIIVHDVVKLKLTREYMKVCQNSELLGYNHPTIC